MKFSKIFTIFLLIFLFISNTNFSLSINDNSEEPVLNSRAAIVIDRNSKTILFGKNENEKRKMASTTKIMTAILVIEHSDLSQLVSVSSKAAGTGGSRLGLHTDDKISIENLLYGLLLCSGNDAAVALAETIAGDLPNFAQLMNSKASELGLVSTHFITPHGLDNDEHYTTAYELALIADYALQNDTFRKIVGSQSHTIVINNYPKNISNTNELLGYLEGVYGVKTGFTNGANRCLVTSVKRGNIDIICVVLGADTKKDRTKDSISLINYIYNNFESINIKEKILSEFNNWKLCNNASFNVEKGISNNLNIVLEDLNFEYLPIKRSEFDNCCIYIYCDNNFQAPLQKDSIIGYLTVSINDKNIISLNILNNSTIEKMDTKAFLFNMIQNYTYCLESIFFR